MGFCTIRLYLWAFLTPISVTDKHNLSSSDWYGRNHNVVSPLSLISNRRQHLASITSSDIANRPGWNLELSPKNYIDNQCVPVFILHFPVNLEHLRLNGFGSKCWVINIVIFPPSPAPPLSIFLSRFCPQNNDKKRQNFWKYLQFCFITRVIMSEIS